jgi:tetratricopeptide (TPR) repeat protein
MLETIREFACECLQADVDEEQRVRLAHAAFYLTLALDASQALVGPEQQAWLTRLDAEEPNIHAALAWMLAHGTAESALQCASALWRYWLARGRLVEGKEWLERAFARADAERVPPLTRADAHNALGNLLGNIGDYAAARQHHEAALALRRSSHDAAGIAGTLNNLGLIAAWLGDYHAALALHTESLEIRRTLNDRFGLALSLSNLGDVELARGDFDRAWEFQGEALRLREEVQHAVGSAYAIFNLGEIARLRGDSGAAGRHLHDSLRRFEALGDRIGIAYATCSLADLASREGDAERAATLIQRALQTRAEIGDKRGTIECLEALGLTAIRERSYRVGLRLLAAAQSLREVISCPLPPVMEEALARELADARRELGASVVDELRQERLVFTLDQAVELAQETVAALRGKTSEPLMS